MPHRKDTQSPPDSLPPARPARLFWFAGLALGIAAGAFVAVQLAGLGGPVGQ
jgi:hypothetical protein